LSGDDVFGDEMIRASLTVEVRRGGGCDTVRAGLSTDPCFAWIVPGALTVVVGGDGDAPAFGGAVADTISGAKTSTLKSNVR
jgi:hypothetical protein